ncbi:MAG: hypothetical protein D6826_10185 [Alphaproteobacteria bacterium]|nr:MAG: hypothetical protein D6826_10185 [Alphaproteobacteria bacterium]
MDADTRSRFTALVLAASRGPDDPVARHAGVDNKVFVPIHGRAMLSWVVRALEASPSVARIAVVLDTPERLEAEPELAGAVAAGRLVVVPAGASPSASVAGALAALGNPFPVLVTTADHPLLCPQMVEHFCASVPHGCDIAVAMARATVVRRACPDAVRTYYRFADGGYSGCNLYALCTPAALRAVAFWGRVERYRKRPWRLLFAIGPLTAVRLALGRLTLDVALRRLSRIVGATARAVEMPFAEAAIDVDKPADLALVTAILAGRPDTQGGAQGRFHV